MSGVDIVGEWQVPLSDGIHTVEFGHGTASGRRIVRVDSKEIVHTDWMFKLVGDQEFFIGKVPCVVRIEPVSGFSYSYSLIVDGKPLEDFTKKRNSKCCTWSVDNKHRVVLEKDTLDIWVDGVKVDATGEFVDGGTETHFQIGDSNGCIKAVRGTNKKEGIAYTLMYNGQIVASESDSSSES